MKFTLMQTGLITSAFNVIAIVYIIIAVKLYKKARKDLKKGDMRLLAYLIALEIALEVTSSIVLLIFHSFFITFFYAMFNPVM